MRIAVVCPYDLSAPGGVQDQYTIRMTSGNRQISLTNSLVKIEMLLFKAVILDVNA